MQTITAQNRQPAPPQTARNSINLRSPSISCFAPKMGPKRALGGADNLSTLGWRYQKQGSKNPNLSILGKKHKMNLSAFDWRYQKRGFIRSEERRVGKEC